MNICKNLGVYRFTYIDILLKHFSFSKILIYLAVLKNKKEV